MNRLFAQVLCITKNYLRVLNNYAIRSLSSSQNVGNASTTIEAEAGRIVWIDLEMTGLDVEECSILEIACLVTDAGLNIIAECPDIVIHQPSEVLDNMNSWCIKQHGKTGLTDASRYSTVSVADAEKKVLNFLYRYTQPKMSPLAGNSVYMDRLFLKRYMPQIDDYLHYRIIDVSTVKELCRRWNPELYGKAPAKQFLHRSSSDIKESVAELRWYRQHFMHTTE